MIDKKKLYCNMWAKKNKYEYIKMQHLQMKKHNWL